jgi:hypothetical protein
MSAHTLAVAAIVAVSVTGYAAFLYFAVRRPRAREGEEAILRSDRRAA